MKLPRRIKRSILTLVSRDQITDARSRGVRVGANCRFIETSSSTFGSEPYLISIGDHVTISEGVRFITHDGGVWVFREQHPDIDVVAPIIVGDNVFIGLGAIILPGVTIGDDVVVAAGSVVTRSVDSRTVIGGVPAKRLRYLDEYEASSLSRSLRTKGLSPDEKKVRLLREFGLEN